MSQQSVDANEQYDPLILSERTYAMQVQISYALSIVIYTTSLFRGALLGQAVGVLGDPNRRRP
jgi:hypothetical protein